MPGADSRESITLAVLSRYFPSITRIIATTSFSHLYRGAFTPTTGEFSWEKKELAGSSFLCASYPRPSSSPSSPSSLSSPADDDEEYHLIILNRLGMTNFIWTLQSTECIEDDGTYLVFNHTSGFSPLPPEPGYEKIDDQSCWGIWVFPNPSMADEREKMRESLMECAKKAEERTRAQERLKRKQLKEQRKPQPQLQPQPQPQPQSQPQSQPPPPPLRQQQQRLYRPQPPQQPPASAPTPPNYVLDGGAPLTGYSIMSQVFGVQADGGEGGAAAGGKAPLQHYFGSPPPPQQYFPAPTYQLQHPQQQQAYPPPAQNGNDILGRLFENARMRTPHGGGGEGDRGAY